MKKIMFNDFYGLTKAVLKGQKTMTRRIIPELKGNGDGELTELGIDGKGRAVISLVLELPFSQEYLDIYPHYQPGEVVAVAQCYKDIRDIIGDIQDGKSIKSMAGWSNKMFVAADLMPHHIRITDVRVERLQDISDEDCLREGIKEEPSFPHKKSYPFYFDGGKHGLDNHFSTPRKAFAALIDKVSGKGTWQRNPWVFVYELELVK